MTSPIDRAFQRIYRVGFCMARLWWRLRKPHHRGALVALWVGDRILVVQQSYRAGLTLPGGGVRSGEPPEVAAQRELREELGLVMDATHLVPACVLRGDWDYRRDQVHVFTLHLAEEPVLRPDRREIADACFVPIEMLAMAHLTPTLRAYLECAGIGRANHPHPSPCPAF
ncbi:MAG TPA: NUDIX hydrolase [Acetobacteraceae bacterium]|nr:NUDIX hydrolase [Acetobacteraceae bacterium]